MYIQPNSFEELSLSVGEVVLIIGSFVLAAYIAVRIYDWWKDNF